MNSLNTAAGPAAARPKAQSPSRAELSRVLKLMLPRWKISALLLLCIALGAAFTVVPPLMIRGIIDEALPHGDRMELYLFVGAIIIAAILGGLAGVWRNYLATVVGQDAILQLRCGLYRALLAQSLEFFKKTRSGEIISRIENDVGGIQSVVSGTLVTALANLVTVLATLVVIFFMDWWLALIASAVLPLFILPARKVGLAHTRVSRETQESLADMSSITQETLSVSGYLVVRLFGAQNRVAERFEKRARTVRDLQVRSSMIGRWFLMWVMLFITIGPAIIYLAGGLEVIAGRMSIGTVVAFVTFLTQLYLPASMLANTHVEIMGALSLFRRIFEYLDLPQTVIDPQKPVRLASAPQRLRFDGVSMCYEPGTTAVTDISFVAKPGQMVALVGPSGAGKTTLAWLAARIYDPSSGKITLDGTELRQLPLEDLSRWIGTVTQEATLFNASIEDNLRYAKPDATLDDLVEACKLAQIHDAIAALPHGYATVVGERGYALSGGERQRLSLARVLLRDPKLLILDEATSALDSRSEALIQQALDTVLRGRTSLVIAHRLSTIVRADLILVLDHGRIVERGTHAELLRRGGLYAQLFAAQTRREEKVAAPAREALPAEA